MIGGFLSLGFSDTESDFISRRHHNHIKIFGRGSEILIVLVSRCVLDDREFIAFPSNLFLGTRNRWLGAKL